MCQQTAQDRWEERTFPSSFHTAVVRAVLSANKTAKAPKELRFKYMSATVQLKDAKDQMDVYWCEQNKALGLAQSRSDLSWLMLDNTVEAAPDDRDTKEDTVQASGKHYTTSGISTPLSALSAKKRKEYARYQVIIDNKAVPIREDVIFYVWQLRQYAQAKQLAWPLEEGGSRQIVLKRMERPGEHSSFHVGSGPDKLPIRVLTWPLLPGSWLFQTREDRPLLDAARENFVFYRTLAVCRNPLCAPANVPVTAASMSSLTGEWTEREHKTAETKQDKGGKCARCQLVSYCSAACQKAHWKEHKKLCGQRAAVFRLFLVGEGEVRADQVAMLREIVVEQSRGHQHVPDVLHLQRLTVISAPNKARGAVCEYRCCEVPTVTIACNADLRSFLIQPPAAQ